MKKCMYCGHENEDTSIVCAKCGNTLLDIPMDHMPPLEETHDEASAPKAETGPVVQDEQGTSSEDVSTPAQEAAPEQLSSGHAPEEALYQNAGYPGAGYPQNGAGVPGAGMVMLAMVLRSVGLPVEGIALVAGVDRIFDMGRTVVNITGDASCAVVVSAAQRKKQNKAKA